MRMEGFDPIHCIKYISCTYIGGFPGGSVVKKWLKKKGVKKKSGKKAEMKVTLELQFRSLGREESLEEETATHSSIILAWKIPWTEEPGRLQSMELQRVGHD